MAVNIERTLPPDVFTHKMVQCVLGVSYTLFRNCRESCFYELGSQGLMVNSVFYTCESQIVAASNLPWKKPLVPLFLHCSDNFGQHLNFLSETDCLPFLAVKSSHSTVDLIRLTEAMAVKTHRTLGSDTFSHGRVQCVLVVSFTLLRTCRESCLCEPGYGSLMAKAVYFPCESLRVPASNPPEKHSASLISLLQQKLWSII